MLACALAGLGCGAAATFKQTNGVFSFVPLALFLLCEPYLFGGAPPAAPVPGWTVPALVALRFVGAAVVLFVPTFLMGATLPILVRGLTRHSAELGARISRLYWVNTLGAVAGTPDMQARYIHRHAQILDQAEAAAVFQITFSDLDLSASPPPSGSILPLFAHLGLVDSALGPKPALAVWDSLLGLKRRP